MAEPVAAAVKFRQTANFKGIKSKIKSPDIRKSRTSFQKSDTIIQKKFKSDN